MRGISQLNLFFIMFLLKFKHNYAIGVACLPIGVAMVDEENRITHDQDQHYFKINIGNHCAYLAYAKVGDGAIEVYRTYVPDEFRGKGVAAQLAQALLAFADQQHLKVIATCSYMQSYMKKMGRST